MYLIGTVLYLSNDWDDFGGEGERNEKEFKY